MIKKLFKAFFFIIVVTLISKPSYSNQSIEDQIKEIDANVIFMRHALAPGYGDPESFNLENCNSQRNLNGEGKKQAQQIGQYFTKNEIFFLEILTSEWCRCIDTAKEMNIGASKTFDGLNSFFQDYLNKPDVMKKLNLKLSQLDKEKLTLMITHQVVISEVTNISTQSGGIILYNSKNKNAKEFNIIDLQE